MRTLPLLLILVAFVVAYERKDPPREVTIDSAFRYDGHLFLISGDEYMAITPKGLEQYLKVRSGDTEVPPDLSLQAAVHRPHKPIVYYFGNEKAYSSNQTSETSKLRFYRKHREFLQNGGPDAASWKDGYYYIFRGCEFVRQRATLQYLGEPENITDIHESLPCDIDAAWRSENGETMTLLKGDRIWNWTGDEIHGPVPFESEYIIWSWQLAPTPDDRFQL